MSSSQPPQVECRWCGAQFPEGAEKCPQCARPVLPHTTRPVATSAGVPGLSAAPPTVRRASRKVGWLRFGLPVAAVVAAAAAVVVMHRPSSVLPACALPPEVQYKSMPAWSADGRRALVLGRSGDRRLGIVLDTSGAEPRVLLCRLLPEHVRVHEALDGTGAHLFYAAGPDNDVRIWMASVADGKVREVTAGAWPMPPPAGDVLAYRQAAGDADSGVGLRVVEGRGPGTPVSSAVLSPIYFAWSPDGTRIAYGGRQVSASAEGDVVAVASVSGGKPRETVVPGTAGADYHGLAWIDANTLAVAATQKNTNNQDVFRIISYDVANGAARELLPVSPSQVLATYSPVWISDGAKRVFWQAPPDRGGTFGLADLETGGSVTIQFPEEVEPGPSPDGGRVLAVGRQSGALYFAHPAADGSQWTVEQLQLK